MQKFKAFPPEKQIDLFIQNVDKVFWLSIMTFTLQIMRIEMKSQQLIKAKTVDHVSYIEVKKLEDDIKHLLVQKPPIQEKGEKPVQIQDITRADQTNSIVGATVGGSIAAGVLGGAISAGGSVVAEGVGGFFSGAGSAVGGIADGVGDFFGGLFGGGSDSESDGGSNSESDTDIKITGGKKITSSTVDLPVDKNSGLTAQMGRSNNRYGKKTKRTTIHSNQLKNRHNSNKHTTKCRTNIDRLGKTI